MSEGYRPYVSEIGWKRDRWIKTATVAELREAIEWAHEAETAAAEETNLFSAELIRRIK